MWDMLSAKLAIVPYDGEDTILGSVADSDLGKIHLSWRLFAQFPVNELEGNAKGDVGSLLFAASQNPPRMNRPTCSKSANSASSLCKSAMVPVAATHKTPRRAGLVDPLFSNASAMKGGSAVI